MADIRREDHEKEMYRIKCKKFDIEKEYIEVKDRLTDIIHDKKKLERRASKLEQIAELLKEEVTAQSESITEMDKHVESNFSGNIGEQLEMLKAWECIWACNYQMKKILNRFNIEEES